MAKCPVCGASTTWIQSIAQDTAFDKDAKIILIPDKCHFCKEEEQRWEHEWEVGLDVYSGNGYDAEHKPQDPTKFYR